MDQAELVLDDVRAAVTAFSFQLKDSLLGTALDTLTKTPTKPISSLSRCGTPTFSTSSRVRVCPRLTEGAQRLTNRSLCACNGTLNDRRRWKLCRIGASRLGYRAS